MHMAALIQTRTESECSVSNAENDIIGYLKAEKVKLTDDQFKIITDDFEWTKADLFEVNIDNEKELKKLCRILKISLPVKIKLKSAIRKLQNNADKTPKNLNSSSKTEHNDDNPSIISVATDVSEEYKQQNDVARTNITGYKQNYSSLNDTDLLLVDNKNITNITITLIGESDVGKTSIITRVGHDAFAECEAASTLGYDITYKTYKILDQIVKLRIIDTAGTEKHHSISKWIYRVSHGFLLVFDVNDMESFIALKNWIDKIDELGSEYARRFIVGNKIDKKNERVVSYETGSAFAESNKYTYFEMSAKSGANVRQAFMLVSAYLLKDDVMDKIGSNTNINKSDTDLRSMIVLDGDEIDRQKKICCF
eukprot:452988_1